MNLYNVSRHGKPALAIWPLAGFDDIPRKPRKKEKNVTFVVKFGGPRMMILKMS